MSHSIGNRATAVREEQVRERNPLSKSPHIDLTKSYFKLLQCIHHLEILNKCISDNTCPIGMRRKVDHLTGFIKPASPDNNILTRIGQNTNIWMMNNIIALRDHYDTLSVAIHTGLGPFQPVAADKAIRWARIRYQRKLTGSSINTFHSRLLVTNSHTAPPAQTPRVPSTGPLISTSTHHSSTSIPIPHASTSTFHTLTLFTRPPPPLLTKPNLPTSAKAPSRAPKAGPVLPGQPRTTPLSKPPPLLHLRPPLTPWTHRTPPVLPLPPLLPNHLADTGWPKLARSHNRLNSKIAGSEPVKDRVVLTSSTPPPPIPLRTPTPPHPRTISPTNIGPTPHPSASPAPHATASTLATPLASRTLHTPPAVSVMPSHPGLASGMPSHAATGPSRAFSPLPSGARNHPSLSLLGERTQPLADPNSWEPVRHKLTQRKHTDWSLNIRKSIVFLGDSNLSRIPPLQDSRLQIDSYPGANIRHLIDIIRQLPEPDPRPTIVILSVGILNCMKPNTETTIRKDLLSLLRVATSQFPVARIWFARINDHTGLTFDSRAAIRFLNGLAEEKIDCLPEIDQQLFQLDHRDLVHWTADTARRIFENWLLGLNLSTSDTGVA